MSNVYEIQTNEYRQDEASTWIAKLDRGLTDAETRELQDWMAASAANRELLLQMAEIWDDSNVLSRLSTVFPHTGEQPAREKVSAKKQFVIAASVLVMMTAGLWAVMSGGLFKAVPEAEMVASQGVYETAIGDHSTIELSDGSLLDMNTNSLVRVVYSPTARAIYLERGEINIEVMRDKSRPLSVIAGDRVIQAVGTAFNVKLNSSQEIELVVSHGKVLVGVRPEQSNTTISEQPSLIDVANDNGLLVEKGGFVVLSDAAPEVELLAPKEIEVRLSWADGNLVFRGEPLSDIVEEISRYTTVEFVFLDEDIKKVRVGGLFKAGDVSGFLAALQANFNIVYEQIEDDKILLKPKVTMTN
jgi:transmembrane sensor